MNAARPMVDGLMQGRKEKQKKVLAAVAPGQREGGGTHA